MKRDTEITKVIFKMARYENGEWEVLAFLPGAPANPGSVQCYAHVGQHGEASYDFYVQRCRPCAKKDYAVLKKEMESLFGYRFKVVHKISKKDRENAWKLLR